MRNVLVLLILPFFVACKLDSTQPKVLEKNCGFNLELVNFNEDAPILYSKHLQNGLASFEENVEGEKISDTIFKYRISNIITETMGFEIPKDNFGYLYKSPEIDSIAKFQNIYFNTIYTLTNLSKKPVAYYLEATFENPQLRKQYLDEFIEKYGKPTQSFYIRSEFNQCSYEWDLKDRTIQIETSYGWGASFSTDGKSSNGKYYRFDMLIINNMSKEKVFNAHIFEVPDKIFYEGKFYKYQDFQFEKKMRVEDEFLLNSTNEVFKKDEYGQYNIENAEVDE